MRLFVFLMVVGFGLSLASFLSAAGTKESPAPTSAETEELVSFLNSFQVVGETMNDVHRLLDDYEIIDKQIGLSNLRPAARIKMSKEINTMIVNIGRDMKELIVLLKDSEYPSVLQDPALISKTAAVTKSYAHAVARWTKLFSKMKL